MTEYHVAIDHLESADPDSPMRVTTTYLGTCDQTHVDEVRAIASLEDSPRLVKQHPHIEGAFMVLRDDYDLDVYVPVDAPEYRVYAPDPAPKGGYAEGGFLDPTKVAAGSVTAQDLMDGEDLLPRGASGPAYITGVVRFGDQVIGGASDSPNKPPRAVWHTTESPAGRTYFYSIAAYLIRIGAEPQVIYDPDSDLLGQLGPLTQSGRALANDGTYRTNRTGRVCIQVEVLGHAKSPWTNGFDASKKPNYQRLIAAMRAHGIPDVWPVGKPPATAAAATKRPKTTWEDKGGHYAHGQIRGQNHWDPGAIDITVVPGPAAVSEPGSGGGSASTSTYTVKKGDTLFSIAAAHDTTVGALVALNRLKDANDLAIGQKLKLPGKTQTPAPARYEPYPGDNFFHAGRYSPLVTALGRRLVQLGFGRYYNQGPGPNWTNADRSAVAAFQRSREELASDADGYPGPKTWAALRIPKL